MAKKTIKTSDHNTDGSEESLKALQADLMTYDWRLIHRINYVTSAYEECIRIFKLR